MPDTENAWRFGPWIIGLIIYLMGIVGIAFRNEYTTKKVNTALFDDSGDLRLVKKKDCQDCVKSLEKKIDVEAKHRTSERQEMRDELRLIHQKIDNLPEKTIRLLKNIK